MLSAYIQAAMDRARYEYLPDDRLYYAEIPELPGVWASADHEEDLATELREVLEGWIVLGISLHHPLPILP